MSEQKTKAAHLPDQYADEISRLASPYIDKLYYDQDIEKAVEQLQRAAGQGNAEAQYWLGRYHQYGRGVALDLKKAAALFQAAADQGHPKALLKLSDCYEDGEGVEKDAKKALVLLQIAAERDSWALYYLGRHYEHGLKGVEENPQKAVELYQAAADQGDPDAQCQLGLCYAEGRGIEKDTKKATELYQAAAVQGHYVARLRTGWAYRNGISVAQDPKKANDLFEKDGEAFHSFLTDLQRHEDEKKGKQEENKAVSLSPSAKGPWEAMKNHSYAVGSSISVVLAAGLANGVLALVDQQKNTGLLNKTAIEQPVELNAQIAIWALASLALISILTMTVAVNYYQSKKQDADPTSCRRN